MTRQNTKHWNVTTFSSKRTVSQHIISGTLSVLNTVMFQLTTENIVLAEHLGGGMHF